MTQPEQQHTETSSSWQENQFLFFLAKACSSDPHFNHEHPTIAGIIACSMDPPASSCMRNSHPATALWGCLRNHHTETGGTAGPQHYPQAPFSFHHKPDFVGYSDFSTSCLAAAPQSLPRDEGVLDEHHPSFQHPAWHFTMSEGRRHLPMELTLGSEETESDDPNLDASVGTSEGYILEGNAASDTQKKLSRRKKGNVGKWKEASINS